MENYLHFFWIPSAALLVSLRPPIPGQKSSHLFRDASVLCASSIGPDHPAPDGEFCARLCAQKRARSLCISVGFIRKVGLVQMCSNAYEMIFE